MKVRLRIRKKKALGAILMVPILTSVNLLLLEFGNFSSRSFDSLFYYPLKNPACPLNLTVDILSIASIHRLDYPSAQNRTFATHCSVRNFFTATEKDDADPECESKLSKDTVRAISNFCRNGIRWARQGKRFMEHLSGHYAFHKWLFKKKNPQGWVCAQTRPAQALFNLIEKYKKRNETFPDYLLIIDDDTYYNMKLFAEEFGPLDSSEPIAVAGCRVRTPGIENINFTFPFGGYGTTVSKGWLQKLVKPIECPRDTGYCNAINVANYIGEKAVFKNGMTIAELMYAYSNFQPFHRRDTWKVGFCLHSDWFIAYFTNFYNISNHVNDAIFAGVPQERLGALMGSEINRGAVPYQRRICDFHSGNCHSKTHACHYSNPSEMKAVTDIVRWQNPAEFRVPASDCIDCGEDELRHFNEKSPIVDILTLVTNPNNTRAQKMVVGSHKSVRSFLNISEFNTHDPSCSQADGPNLVHLGIISNCISKHLLKKGGWLFEKLHSSYSKHAGDNLTGWLCKQRRLIQGVSKLLNRYRRAAGTTELPDYLILLDDKTYFNMHVFPEMLRNIERDVKTAMGMPFNGNDPLAAGGCMRPYEISNGVTFRAPLLDFGIILNKAILEELLKPIHCTSKSAQKSPRCGIIEESQAGEKSVFHEGMSAVDLMNSLANADLRDFNDTIGMCFESEWLLSYFVQFYAGKQASTSPPEVTLAPAKSSLHTYLESISQTVLCHYAGPDCNIDAPFCSEIAADQMMTYLRD